MLLRQENNAVTYFSFQFSAETKRKRKETKSMYQASLHLSEVQEKL